VAADQVDQVQPTAAGRGRTAGIWADHGQAVAGHVGAGYLQVGLGDQPLLPALKVMHNETRISTFIPPEDCSVRYRRKETRLLDFTFQLHGAVRVNYGQDVDRSLAR
jgi:hypothetical protein